MGWFDEQISSARFGQRVMDAGAVRSQAAPIPTGNTIASSSGIMAQPNWRESFSRTMAENPLPPGVQPPMDDGRPIPIQSPHNPAAQTAGAQATPGGSPSMPLEQAIQQYQQSHPYSPQSYLGLFDHLKQMGYQVERPTRAGGTMQSDDKLVGPDGKMYDLISGVDGANPTWSTPAHIPGEYWFNGQRVQKPEEVSPGMFGPDGYSLNGINGLSSFSAPGLAAPFTQQFQAPTGTDDPGFQFAMEQGQQGLERSAAARGTLLTGGTLKDLANYTTGAALQGYGDAWNRAKNVYDTNRGTFWGNQTNAFNKLSGLAGAGADAASSYAANTGNLYQQQGANNAQQTATQNQNWQNTFGNLADLGSGLTQDYLNRRKAKPITTTGLGAENWG